MATPCRPQHPCRGCLRKRPSIAAAAAISGLTRCVRPPLPCRPSKLRFEVLAELVAARQNILVHRNAHAASRIAPFKTGFAEDSVESFGFRLGLHRTGTRTRPEPASGVSPRASLALTRGGTQVF